MTLPRGGGGTDSHQESPDVRYDADAYTLPLDGLRRLRDPQIMGGNVTKFVPHKVIASG